MLKQLAWNTFKNTGNLDTFMELVEVTNTEKNIKENKNENEKGLKYGNNKDEGNRNS